jgi:streptogramin lyase
MHKLDHIHLWGFRFVWQRISFLVITFYLVCNAQFIFAQSLSNKSEKNEFKTVHWDSKDGLTLGYKNSMLKDVNGFLWIGSPVGLNRFDGNTFKAYYPGEIESGTIIGSHCLSMVEDSLHNIWVGTNKGLVHYNSSTDSFHSIPTIVTAYSDLTTIIPFWSTRDDVYCLESARYLTQFDLHTLQRKVLAELPPRQDWKNQVVMASTVFDSASNSIWMLKGENQQAVAGLVQVSMADKSIQDFSWTCFDRKKDHGHFSAGMCYDKKLHGLWLNSPDGLVFFDLVLKRFSRPDIVKPWVAIKNYSPQTGISIDPKGIIWLATWPAGILLYDPEFRSMKPFSRDADIQKQLSDWNMRIYFDPEGMVWMSYLNKKGMNQLIPISPSVKQYSSAFKHIDHPVPDRIQNFTLGTNGNIWIGTMEGILSYDPITESFNSWEYNKRVSGKNEKLFPLGLNKETQKAWLYNWDEHTMFELDLQTGKRRFTSLNFHDSSIHSFDVSAHYARPFLNGLVLQVDMNGLYFVNGESAKASLIAEIPYHVTNIAVANDQYVFVRLHFTAHNLCYSRENGKWIQVPNPIDNIEWACIAYDKSTNSYWVGGVKELYHFDRQFRLIKKYTEEDGMRGIGYLSILIDNAGKVWFNNSEGMITWLEPKTGMVGYLTEKDGYKKNIYYWQIPFIKDETGNLYFAGENGIDRISPLEIKNYPPPLIYFDKILINDKLFLSGSENKKNIRLTLNDRQRKITFKTGILDYFSEHDNLIRYKLEGLNSHWQIAPPNHMIQYEELPPGTYKLVIQASRSGNIFQGPERIIDITISAAFWETVWFRVLSVLTLAIFLYALIRNRIHQRYQARLARSEKDSQLADMRQKTAELQQQTLVLEMQALRAQMNPHFIFNSLNAINKFILQNDKIQASEYLTKFSRLVRMILENSKETSISLESELESLNLYLELESLRFQDRFRYKISVPDELLESEVQVPPLIIQPFAENAIWHGLMHKPETGQLDIEISLEKDQLCIRITDDGIGRQQSKLLESKSVVLHKSMGQQITLDRIALLGKSDDVKSSIRINDLTGADGKGAGTEVIIEMPLIYD